MADQEVDLWGDPIPPRVERRGRPEHAVTGERRLRVMVLRALNQTQTEIAAAMGISEPTLRRYYLRELQGGMAQKRAEALMLLWGKAADGNVAAIKEFLRQTEKSDLAGLRPLHPPRPPKLGKKVQAAIDAVTPDTTTTMGELMAERAGLAKLH